MLVDGYAFGVGDHAIHVPFLLRRLDPGLFPGDPMVDAALRHASVFWEFQAPLARALPLPVLYGALHLVSLFALAWVAQGLAGAMSGSVRARALAAVAATHGWLALGGAPTWDPLMLPRTFVLPAELGALWLFLSGRRLPAFALLGLAFDLHATSAAQLAFALLVATVARARVDGARTLLAPLAFLLAASPLLARLGPGGDAATWPPWAEVDPAWGEVLRARLGHHLFPSTWPSAHWILAGLTLLMYRVGRRAPLATARARYGPRLDAVVAGLVLLGAVAGTLGSEARPTIGLLQLHPWQAFRLVTLLAVLRVAVWAARIRPRDVPAAAALGALVLSLAFGVLPLAGAAAGILALGERAGEARLGRRGAILGAAWLGVAGGAMAVARLGGKGGGAPPWLLSLAPAFDPGLFGGVLVGVALALAARWRQVGEAQAVPGRAEPEALGWGPGALAAGLVVLAGIGLLLGTTLGDAQHVAGRDRARWLPAGPRGPERELEEEVRRRVPRGDRVLLPPYRLDDFRIFARRSPVVGFKDGGEALYGRDLALSFRDRLSEVAGGVDPFAGVPLEGRGRREVILALKARAEAGWSGLTPGERRGIGLRHGAPWVVMEWWGPGPALPEDVAVRVWSNRRYQLLRFRGE